MTYDDGLAHRIRESLGDRPGLSEQEMFGGIAFMTRGNMVCGVIDDALLARIGPETYDDALDEPHVRPMDITGREMRGLVLVDPPGLTADEAFETWLDRCLSFAESLPAK
ncbi:TfoX/Sxy family protein [Halomicroarcula sp. GCM10025817]|uniref:TfoX/Sxy family protein n=1 Tax=Haloarcula TaxID=2237 RepID=UPI0023E8097F|nr:TfoX/Sxy family protein [Halomicroarcula sp. SYNS111]